MEEGKQEPVEYRSTRHADCGATCKGRQHVRKYRSINLGSQRYPLLTIRHIKDSSGREILDFTRLVKVLAEMVQKLI